MGSSRLVFLFFVTAFVRFVGAVRAADEQEDRNLFFLRKPPPLGRCQGDCDTDWDCAFGLTCFDASEPTPGCNSFLPLTDLCHEPLDPLALVLDGNDGEPNEAYPLSECRGDCDNDEDCAGLLECFYRDTLSPVPGCGGLGAEGGDYCYDPSNLAPNLSPTFAPTETYTSSPVTYKPGELTVFENGIVLSTGLTSRIIAQTNQHVPIEVGEGRTASKDRFHWLPDGAATFPDPDGDGWAYVSNSEFLPFGGVGAIYFDRDGRVKDYKRLLRTSTSNCGGGRSWWGTWLSGEEWSRGQIWEVDPWGRTPPRETLVGDVRTGPGRGAKYESVAYDNRNMTDPRFFATIDDERGPLLRFRPDPAAVLYAADHGYANLLHTNQGGGMIHDFLVLDYESGTFFWTTDREAAADSAESYYRNAEGIDVLDGFLYFTTKRDKHLFILDLDGETFEVSSTRSGAFQGQPDQVARVLGRTGDEILYFNEDGSDLCGVHGRDAAGNFFTILDSNSTRLETSGLSFSPDNMFMYLSYQFAGKIFEIRRTDGYPFGGRHLDIQYHSMD